MQPSRHNCLYASFALALLFLAASRTAAESLTITSSPPGATVEIDGLPAGDTPYETNFPDGYFHKPHTAFASRLDHSVSVKISKEGYLSQRVTLTEGPFAWTAITGRRRGSYFLLKTDHFNIQLDPISYGSGEPAETIDNHGPMRPYSGATYRENEESSRSGSGSVAITSDPAGAEIYIDGKFVGQTPSTISLASGSHHVELKSKGRQSWERNLNVTSNSQLTLLPVLEQSP